MFEEIVERIRNYIAKVTGNELIEYDPFLFESWNKSKEVVTRNELAYELGKRKSALLLLWGKADNRVYLSKNSDGSLAVIVICDVIWNSLEKYDCFRALRDTFYSLDLSGVTIRSLPSQLRVWLRVSKKAVAGGFSLGVFARAVVEAMNSLKFVKATDVVILTSERDLEALKEVFSTAKRMTEALIKMHEEKLLNCEECDYKDVCSEIPELKMIRERIRKL